MNSVNANHLLSPLLEIYFYFTINKIPQILRNCWYIFTSKVYNPRNFEFKVRNIGKYYPITAKQETGISIYLYVSRRKTHILTYALQKVQNILPHLNKLITIFM